MSLEEALALICSSPGTTAVAVRDNNIVLLGSSKAAGSFDREEIKAHYFDHMRDQMAECINSHAAYDLVVNASMEGIALDGCTALLYELPCLHCTKILIGSGVKEILTAIPLNQPLIIRFLNEAKVSHKLMDMK